MAAPIVTDGPYMGFDLSELESELTRYKDARRQAGANIASASYNGDSFTYGPRRDWSLDEWQGHLQTAFVLLGDSRFKTAPTNMGVIRLW